MITKLSDREKTILHSIVYSYIQTATPIGSRYISKRRDIGLSAATIRNVMSDLEFMGLIGHPHTSAGRIPTDKGYRFYVDELMAIDNVSEIEQATIHSTLQISVDPDEVLKIASKILGTISHQLGIVSAPKMTTGVFEKLELIQISSVRLLVIISIGTGLVKTIMLEIFSEIPKQKLEHVSQLLNEKLCGLTIAQIRDTFTERMYEYRNEDSGLVRLFIDSVDKLFDEKKDKVHIGGAKNILAQPEFGEADHFKSIIELVDNEDILIHVFENVDPKSQETTVTIGEETKIENLKDYSIVTTNYTVGNLTGTVGILGTKRMNYSKMIPLVDFVAKAISSMFQPTK